MGAVIQRAQTCLTCGGSMPITGRVDRRYCKGACRTLAYRVRRRIKASRPPGPLEPEWGQPGAVVKTMLTSLAQIQARVLDFAHQLEQEELYARPPVRTGTQPSAAGNPEPKPSTEEHSTDWGHRQLALFDESQEEGEPDANVEDSVGGSSVADEGSIIAVPSADVSLQRPISLDNSLTNSSSDVRLQARLEEVLRQRDALQSDLLAERERTGRLDAQLSNLQKEATESIGRWKEQCGRLHRDNEGLALRVRDLKLQLQQASATLATWERAGSESLTIVAHSNTLQQENELLQAELRRLRPPSADADPLLRLMLDHVKALHWLATYQIRSGVKVTGELLPCYDNEQILAAAQRYAFAARRDHYYRFRMNHEPKPSWVKEDQLLDASSEKKVYEDAKYKHNMLLGSVESARMRMGDKL